MRPERFLRRPCCFINLQALLCAQLPGPSGVEAGERVLIGVRALARMPALLMLLIVSASLKLDWVLGRRFLFFLLVPGCLRTCSLDSLMTHLRFLRNLHTKRGSSTLLETSLWRRCTMLFELVAIFSCCFGWWDQVDVDSFQVIKDGYQKPLGSIRTSLVFEAKRSRFIGFLKTTPPKKNHKILISGLMVKVYTPAEQHQPKITLVCCCRLDLGPQELDICHVPDITGQVTWRSLMSSAWHPRHHNRSWVTLDGIRASVF